MTNVVKSVSIGGQVVPFGGGGNSEGQEVVYLTQAEYDALPASKLTDGKIYKVKTTGIVPGGSTNASDVEYDNTTSGLTATNVQDAIDEVNSKVIDTYDSFYAPAGSSLYGDEVHTKTGSSTLSGSYVIEEDGSYIVTLRVGTGSNSTTYNISLNSETLRSGSNATSSSGTTYSSKIYFVRAGNTISYSLSTSNSSCTIKKINFLTV